jgi:coenzyme F420-reducing hydrogenase delta subunit
MLDDIGLGGERLRMVNLSASEAPTFVAQVREMVETVERLGPNPLRMRPESGG